MEKKVLKIEGMSCGHCVKAVEQAVNGITASADAAANLKKGTVSFSFDPAKTPLDNIKAAIEEAGYTVIQ